MVISERRTRPFYVCGWEDNCWESKKLSREGGWGRSSEEIVGPPTKRKTLLLNAMQLWDEFLSPLFNLSSLALVILRIPVKALRLANPVSLDG